MENVGSERPQLTRMCYNWNEWDEVDKWFAGNPSYVNGMECKEHIPLFHVPDKEIMTIAGFAYPWVGNSVTKQK